MPESRRRGHPVCVRLSDIEQAIVDARARRDGFLHLDGEPNRSAVIRRIIQEAGTKEEHKGD